MKIRLSKNTIAALVFILLMGGSSVAYAFLRVFSPTGYAIKLPKTNVIDYELGSREEEYLITRGVTIVKFYYSQGCFECISQKNFLESFATRNSPQVLLEELKGNATSFPRVIITSYRGRRTFTNATNDEVLDGLCDLMLRPPIDCVMRKV